jgi:hypothetical protein
LIKALEGSRVQPNRILLAFGRQRILELFLFSDRGDLRLLHLLAESSFLLAVFLCLALLLSFDELFDDLRISIEFDSLNLLSLFLTFDNFFQNSALQSHLFFIKPLLQKLLSISEVHNIVLLGA